MSIFNEVNDLLEAINLISFDEEKTDEEKAVLIQQCLEQIQGTFNEKGENLVKVLKEYQAQSIAKAEEIKKLQASKKVDDNNIERIKEYMKVLLHQQNVDKINCGIYKMSLIKSKTTNIIDENKIGEQYYTLEKKFDKTAIKKAILNGEIVEGAEIVENESVKIM